MRKRWLTWTKRPWRFFGIVGGLFVCALAVGCGAYLVVGGQPSATIVAAPDGASPELKEVRPSASHAVDLVFDEPLATASLDLERFSIDNGVSIKSAEYAGKDTVRLTLSRPQLKGRPYTVAIEDGVVSDTAGNLSLKSSMRFAGFGASGGVLTVTHAGGKARPRHAKEGEREETVVVDQLALSAEAGDVRVSEIRVRGLTTSPSMFADLVEAWVFEDNGNGLFEADGRDKQLHVSAPFSGTVSGSPAVFSGLNYPVYAGETKTLWIVFRLGNLAVEGRHIGSEVRYGDIQLAAGTLARHPRLVSNNGGRTIYITEKVQDFAKGRVVDPKTVVVTLAEAVAPSAVVNSAFTVNGDSVEDVQLGADSKTVRIITTKPLETKTVAVEYVPPQVGVGEAASWGDSGIIGVYGGPTYQSPGDTTAPTVPGSVVASVGTTSPVIATILWAASNDAPNPVRGYRIWRSTAAAGLYRSIATTPASPFKDVSGVPDQSYFYKVSAYDAMSNESTLSAASASVTATWTQVPHATYGSGNLCALCHSPHDAATGNGILREISGGTTGTSLCYQCHDGSGAPPEMNVKTGATNSFALASGHTLESLVDTTNVDLTNTCSDCHGPHQNSVGRPTLWRSVINSNTVTGNNNTWCVACHDSKHSWYKPGEAAYDSKIASPSINATYYPTLGTFPGSDVATNPAKNAHAAVVEAGQTEAFACKACHDNHRGTAPQDMLLYALRPSTTVSRANDRQTGAYAQMCLRCHDGSVAGATNIKQHVTANYLDAAAFAGHRVLSPGSTEPTGSPLPCYECHNVHGSGRGNNSNISDARGASLTTTAGASAEQVRKFCLTCHVTSEMPLTSGQVWDSGLNAYRSVRTTETIVGLPRNGNSAGPDGETYNWLKLKAVDGHSNSTADKAKSCYRCHGDKYDMGRNNVHNPGPGESGGALACAQCHDLTYNAMKASSSYHHYMVSDSAVSTNIANPSTLTTTDSRRTCLTCHVDHDIFNPTVNPLNTNGRAANLRSSVATTPVAADLTTYLNTDFEPFSGASVCTSCHKVGITKNTANRLSATDRSTAALKVTSAAYKASAHNYQSLTATFVSDVVGKAFKPNCSKCHDDRRGSDFLGTRVIASHDDTRPALITDFGMANTGATPREEFCFACHSRSSDSAAITPSNPFGTGAYTITTGMKDVYATRSMDATTVNIKGEFTAAGIVSSHPVTATLGAQVECSNCHSVHSAGGANNIVVNPDNTLQNPADLFAISFFTRWYAEPNPTNKAAQARTNRDFCLKCHDGVAPNDSVNTTSTYVPYDVTLAVSQPANPTRRTNNKSVYRGKSHYNTAAEASSTAKAIDGTCGDCHDRHGSTLPALLGVPSRAAAQNFLGTRYIYSLTGTATAVTGNNNSVCTACHSATGSAWPTATVGAYPTTGRWPGSAAYAGANGIHKGSTVVWPGRSADYVGGDCKNCHDPHGTPNAYDELRTDEAVLGTDSYRYELSDYSFCLNCHDGTPGVDIKSKQPASVGGTSVETSAGHTVRSANGQGVTVGEPIPCWVCHSAHGTSANYGLLIKTGLSGNSAMLGDAAGELNVPDTNLADPVNASAIRLLCLSCHTTASLSIQDTDDNFYGSIGTTISKVPTGTIGALGLNRTVVTGGLRLKTLLVDEGHLHTDTQNCLQCHTDIHKPTVPTPGATNCYNCHKTAAFTQMNSADASASASYHHVLGTGGTPDQPFGLGPYPGAPGGLAADRTKLWCLTCHVDHDYFDDRRGIVANGAGNRAMNLRTGYSDTPTYTANTGRTNTDFIGGGKPGICVSCHLVELDRKAPQKTAAGDTTRTPVISETTYTASAHQYKATSTVSRDSSTFQADCSKCHNSNLPPAYASRSFAVHASPERSLLSALATTMVDPIGAPHCLSCHSQVGDFGVGKPTAGKDYYGAETMTVGAEKVFKVMNTGASRHPVAATATGAVACENCHNPHVVSQTATQTNPANGYQVGAYTTPAQRLAYCLQCHDGTPPQKTVAGGVYVPISVRADATWANKTTPIASRSHWIANNSIASNRTTECDDCHDKHGSRYANLVGWSVATTDTVYVRDMSGAKQPINGNNETVCYGCHTAAGLGYPGGEATTATLAEWDSWKIGGYVSPSPSTTRTAVMWPGQSVYAVSPHGSNAWTAPSTLGGGPAKDCNTCHNVHGTTTPYDELTATYTAGDYTLCFACHEGSFSNSANIKRYYPAGNNFGDNAGHRVKTAGGTYPAGTPLPCWECHLTHGSADNNQALLSDARWDNLGDLMVNDAMNREFCLGCHTTEDRYGYSSFEDTVVAFAASDTANRIVGLPRSPVSPTGNKLILPHLQTGLAHMKGGTEPCYECHGEDYTGDSTSNVHNPSSGVPNGGSACYNCHTAYYQMEDDLGTETGTAAGNKNSYHHVLGSGTHEGDWAPKDVAYSTSNQDVYCVSCHTDHNYFNASKNGNLRASINSASGAATAAADFLTTGDNGICVSCHTAALVKDRVAQKDDGTTAVPKIVGSSYTGSSHQYAVSSFYDSAATSFSANCSKCHDDSFDYEQDSTRRFGTHTSSERKLLGPLGDASGADPLGEKNCYRCHSVMADTVGGTKKSADGSDWYGGRAMTAVSQTTFKAFGLTGSKHPVDPNANGSYLECGSCHNVHVSSAATPAVDPDNTYNGMAWTTANKSAFCLKCHDANRPTGVTSDASFVPTTVVMGGSEVPLMNKAAYGATSHWSGTAGGAIAAGEVQPCGACHDKHGSQLDKLLGVFTGGAMSINAKPVTANDEGVCYACHTGASTNATTTPDRSGLGYIEQGTWLGKTTWERGYNSAEHTGSPHAQSTVVWPGTGGPGAGEGGDCKQCHDVHGTPNAKDALRTTNVGGVDSYRFSETVYTFCFACHNGSQAGVSNIATYYPVAYGGTSNAPRAGHKFETGARAGYALPCYDCHNPHGTGDSAYTLMVTAKTGPSTTVVLGDQPNEIKLRPTLTGFAYDSALREFCFACHTRGDDAKGWNGSQYATMAAGTTFEGLDRTSVSSKLRLSNIAGHGSGDSQSCYLCHGGTGNGENNAHSLSTGAAEHLATASAYNNTEAVTGCVGAGAGCHGVTNDLMVVHRVPGCLSKTGVLNCHDIDGAGAGTTEYTSVRPGRTDGGRTSPNMDCADCHDGTYADTYDRIGLNEIYPNGHYSEPTHTAGAASLTGTVTAPSGGTATATCNDCHAAGTAGTGRGMRTQHQGIRITAGNADGNLTCADCHSYSYSTAVSQVVTQSAFSGAGGACTACHTAGVLGAALVKHANTAPSVIGTSTSQASCMTSGAGCHTGGSWDLHVIHRGDGGADPTCGGASGCHDYAKQGARPASRDCDVCHVNYGTTGHYSAVAHSASANMTDDADGTYENPNGEQCEDCHSAELGKSGSANTAHYNAPTVTTCAACHNDMSPNSVLVIKTNSWTPPSCDNCHTTNNNGYSTPAQRHDVYGAATHVGTPVQSNGCGTDPGCHGGTDNDLRRLHDGGASTNSSNPGCTASGDGGMDVPFGAGCHALDGVRPVQKTCGGDGIGGAADGACHTTYADGNHSSANPATHIATTSTSILTSNLTSISAQGNGCGRCHQDGESTYTGANLAITDLNSVSVISSMHETDTITGRTGCSVCHGNTRLNGGGALGGSYTKECSSCHGTFKTTYHRSYDGSHTTNTSAYPCTMSTCHSTNIITTHRSYMRPTQTGVTYVSALTTDTALVTGADVRAEQATPVKTWTVNKSNSTSLTVNWNLSVTQSTTGSGRIRVKDGAITVFTGPVRTAGGTTYVAFSEPGIDISSVGLNRDLTIELYLWSSTATRLARTNSISAFRGAMGYSYTATDDCDICHNNTGRLRPNGSSDAASDPPIPTGVAIAAMDAQCETCHPYYEDYHYPHKASSASDGCLNGCHTYAPAMTTFALDTQTLTGKYSLWAQHANIAGGRTTVGWGNNTTGNGGTIEGGCGDGQTGISCHNNLSLPDSAECADCHGPAGMNDTELHSAIHSLVPNTLAGYTTTVTVDSTFGANSCINICHAQRLDYIHGLSTSNAYGGNTYKTTSGLQGNMACSTCHAAPAGSAVATVNAGTTMNQGVRTLQCKLCHTGNATWPGYASRGHAGGTSTELVGSNLALDFGATGTGPGAAVSGHIMPTGGPYTLAYTIQYYVSVDGWYRSTSATRTSFQFTANQAAAGAAGAAASLRGTTTGDGLPLANGSTALALTTRVTCADCHGKFVATGPQGASVIVGRHNPSVYTTDWNDATSATITTTICGRCHNPALANSTSLKGIRLGSHFTGVYCTTCHIGVPHAWKRPKLLVKTDGINGSMNLIVGDPVPYKTSRAALVGWTKSYTTSVLSWAGGGNTCETGGTGSCAAQHDGNLAPATITP